MGRRRQTRRLGAIVAAALLVLFSARCARDEKESAEAMEARLRDIEKRIRDSMPRIQERALAQEADAAVVREVQEILSRLHEYQDPPSGKLDMVTVNAIQAFQRRAKLRDDGILDERTLRALRAASPAAS